MPHRSLRILMAYEHYPVSIARYWKRAFEKLGHTVESTGHCTGGEITWTHPDRPREAIDLSRWADTPKYELGNKANLYEIGEATYMLSQRADLWINVDAAHYWRGRTACPKIVIGTDPHCINYDNQRRDCDMFVCMQKTYSKPGDFWIPYAFDEDWHYYKMMDITHDVTFLGVFYPERIDDLKRLADAGIKVVSDVGIVYDETVYYYCSGHIAYARPSLLDLPARFFEAFAYGNIPLAPYIPELDLFPDLIPGWHYELYDPKNPSSIVDAVKGILADPVRLNARKIDILTIAPEHTWAIRAQTLIDEIYARGLLTE